MFNVIINSETENVGKTDPSLFQRVSDEILDKIRVPFHLLQVNSNSSEPEIRLQLIIYCDEIIHAVISGESMVKSVRVKSEKFGWSSNPLLQKACSDSKFWLRIWNECGRPRSSAVNSVRIFSKRKFNCELSLHMAEVKINTANKITENTNLIWKLRSSPFGVPRSGIIPVSEWASHFSEQVKCPNSNAQVVFDKEIESIIQTKLKAEVRKLKKKSSSGYDGLYT